MNEITTDFDLDCRACPRLAHFLDAVTKDYPDYHARPIPQFGKLILVSSYHYSRYNTSTKRLTLAMFENVFKQIDVLLER